MSSGFYGFNSSKKEDKKYSLIRNKDYETFWKYFGLNCNKILSESFKILFLRMVSFKPDERPSIDEILNSEWLKEIKDLTDEKMKFIENGMIEIFKNREEELIEERNKQTKITIENLLDEI